MTIDRLTDHDIHDALRLSTQSGWNQLEADWRRLLTLWPATCFAGRENGQLIATSTLATYGETLAWVGMVLVDEAHRARGFGGQILDAALDAARAMQIDTVCLDATDLGRPVYLKRGFRDVAGIDRWARPAVPPDSRGRKPRFSDFKTPALPPSAITWNDIMSLDLQVCGIDRSALLDLLQHEQGVHVGSTQAGEKPRGFALLRPGRTSSHIGPVVAQRQADAIEAIERSLTADPHIDERPFLIDVPRGRLESWLTGNGFTVARKLTRMCLGAQSACLLGPNIFAATSFELG